MRNRSLAFLLMICGLAQQASAVIPGQEGPFPTSGDWSGTTASGAAWDLEHSYVYQWNTSWNGNWYIGSAVAVAPQYLLTARHVGATPGDSYAIINGTKYTAQEVKYAPNDPGQSNPPDLCLVRVDHTLPGYAKLYTGPLSIGQYLFLVGYGNNSASGGAGVARWGTNSISSLSSDYTYATGGGNVTSSLLWASTYDFPSTSYEASFGSGDSGGGTFVKVGTEWQLAGINVLSTPASVAVPNYASWISANAPVPEPTGVAAAAGAGVWLLRRRSLAA